MSDSVRPHRRQPTRLPRPWDSLGKNTGGGCHFLLQWIKVKSEREVAQSCPALSNPMDCSPPGSSVHGIFQAGVLEWGAIAFSSRMALLYVYFKKDRTARGEIGTWTYACGWCGKCPGQEWVSLEVVPGLKTNCGRALGPWPAHLCEDEEGSVVPGTRVAFVSDSLVLGA